MSVGGESAPYQGGDDATGYHGMVAGENDMVLPPKRQGIATYKDKRILCPNTEGREQD